MLWTYALNKAGTGVFASLLVIYLTTQRGIDPAFLALAILTAGIAGTVAGIPLGGVADRFGARRIYMATLGFEAAASVVIILAFNNTLVLVALLLAEVGAAASAAAAAPLVRAHGGDRPAVLRAKVRTVSNVAMAAGAGIAAMVALINHETFYMAALALNTLSFLGAIIVVRKVPSPPRLAGTVVLRRRFAILEALTDAPYLVAAVVNGLLGLHTAFLTFLIPLAMVRLDAEYAWIGPAALVVNTLVIFTLQVRISRKISTHQAAGWAFLASGVLLAAAMGGLVLTYRLEPDLAVLLVVLAVVVLIYSLGEIYSAAGGFEVAFGLAPEGLQGQYFGAFNALFHLGIATGPALLGWLFFTSHPAGPIALVSFFLVSGLLSPWLIRWAAKRSHHTPAAIPTGVKENS